MRRLPAVETLERRAERRYVASLAAVEGEDGNDAAIKAILWALLDRGVTPREVREGGTLEAHFLDVTGNEEGAQGQRGKGA